jgi:polyisoprenyl-phosphate glycosyltransferase
MKKDDYLVTLLVPVYNEEETINTFYNTICNVLKPIENHIEILFVNDGSRDKSVEVIKDLIANDKRVVLASLSRNFGKEAAMTAGLNHAKGDAVIPIDVDLQDPPELILQFIALWQEKGYDTVYGIRVDRSHDTPMKRLTAGGFYRVFNMLSSKVKLPENVGDFRLIDRRVVDTIKSLTECNRFMKGIFAWAGFSSYGIPYERPERSEGTSKFNYWKLWNFALDGIISFSSLPLRVWSYLGGVLAIISFIYMAFIFVKTVIFGIDLPGYASMMCVILFLGSIQLISIGVLGEYVARIFMEVKHRPVYVIDRIYGRDSENECDKKCDSLENQASDLNMIDKQ